jgi:hypothetical protein
MDQRNEWMDRKGEQERGTGKREKKEEEGRKRGKGASETEGGRTSSRRTGRRGWRGFLMPVRKLTE